MTKLSAFGTRLVISAETRKGASKTTCEIDDKNWIEKQFISQNELQKERTLPTTPEKCSDLPNTKGKTTPLMERQRTKFSIEINKIHTITEVSILSSLFDWKL
jgi:hypothetical protein